MTKRTNDVTMEELMNLMQTMMKNMNTTLEAYQKAQEAPTKKVAKKATKKAAPKPKTNTTKKATKTVAEEIFGEKIVKAPKPLTDEEKKERREAYLTEKFGDKETRTKYVQVRNTIATEMLAEAKANGKYWPKAEYKKILNERTAARMKEVNG